MAIFGPSRKANWRSAENALTIHLSADTIENDVNQWHNGGGSRAVQEICSPAIRLDVSPNTRFCVSVVPKPHLLMTFCWQLPSSGHSGMRF